MDAGEDSVSAQQANILDEGKGKGFEGEATAMQHLSAEQCHWEIDVNGPSAERFCDSSGDGLSRTMRTYGGACILDSDALSDLEMCDGGDAYKRAMSVHRFKRKRVGEANTKPPRKLLYWLLGPCYYYCANPRAWLSVQHLCGRI
jgi:hypothetical protein